MQELNVRSNNGGFATILVKKRDSKVSHIPHAAVANLNHTTKLKRLSDKEQRQNHHHQEEQSADILINSFINHVSNMDVTSRFFQNADDEIENNNNSNRNNANARKYSRNLSELSVPEPVVISSATHYVKDEKKNGEKRGRSVVHFDGDNIPVIEGIRVPDDEQDKRVTWRNARVINGELVPYEKGYVPKKAEPLPYGHLVYVPKTEKKHQQANVGPFMKSDNYAQQESNARSVGPFTIEDNIRQAASAERERKSHADHGFGPFTIYDNAKVANSKLIAYIKKINDQESRRDYFAGRSVQFPQNDHENQYYTNSYQAPQMERRMLQNIGNPIYSPSLMYSASSGHQSVTEGSRGDPVLEYAHPDFGVQQASKVEAEPKNKKVKYYSDDIHVDRSPYSSEPALLNSEYYVQQPSSHQDQYNSKQYYGGQTYAFKNTATYPYNYGYLRKVKEQPFYMKFAEHMRDSFQNGFATVHEMTRPVIDPIVEAGQKISKNLGFSQHDKNVAEDKVGIVPAASSSAIIPAIGLVAGGAALGLGAMAVGRIFDGNMLRSVGDISTFDDMEHKRNLAENNENLYLIMDGQYNAVQSNDNEYNRERRSVDEFALFTENAGSNVIRVKRRQNFDMDADTVESKLFRVNRSKKLEPTVEVEVIDGDVVDDNVEVEVIEGGSERLENNKHNIAKRSTGVLMQNNEIGAILQNIEAELAMPVKYGFEEQIRKTDWSNTPCAKNVFCEVMLQQSSDELVLMEKKMETLLSK